MDVKKGGSQGEVFPFTDVYQQQTQQQSQRNIQLTQTRPLSNAERQRRYREKRKADKMNACTTFSQSRDVQPQQEQPQHDVQINKRRPLTNAERQRKHRKLIRQRQQQQQQMEDSDAYTVLSNTPYTYSNHQLQNVDQANHARKRHLNKERQRRFRERQRFESPSTSSHQAQAESFPSDETRRTEWEKALGRENFKATNYTKICSKHFEPESFDTQKLGGTWLKTDALPTIFDFSEQAASERMQQTSQIPSTDPIEPTTDSSESDVPAEYRRKRKYFLGDFKEEDMDCPEKARQVFRLAKDEHVMKSATIKKLKLDKRRLTEKVALLQSRLQETQNKLHVTLTSKSISGGSKTVVEEEQDQSPWVKQDNIPLEPVARIKEEPADDYSIPSTSNGSTSEEFILPDVVSPFRITSPVVEPQLTLSGASLNSPNVPEPSDDGPLKKKLRTDSSNIIIASVSTLASVSKVPPNHTLIRPQSPEQNLDISTPSSLKEHQKHQFDSFGHYLGNKLRNLDPISSACAQKAIQIILLKAEMGKYLNQTQDIKPSIVPVSL